MENPPDNVADTAVALQKRLQEPWLLQWPNSDDEDDDKKPDGDKPDVVKQELPDDEVAQRKSTLAELLVKPVGPILVPSEDEEEDPRKKSWHATITSGEPQLGGEDGFAPQSYETDHHWNVDTRPAWQRHSELGPNLDAEAKRKAPPEAMQR